MSFHSSRHAPSAVALLYIVVYIYTTYVYTCSRYKYLHSPYIRPHWTVRRNLNKMSLKIYTYIMIFQYSYKKCALHTVQLYKQFQL